MKNFKDSFTQFQQKCFVENFLFVKVTKEASYSLEVAFIPGTVKILYDSVRVVE